MNNIIISNTCVGYFVMKKLQIIPYNNPFISSLIPNDNDYFKLINNLSYYLEIEPILGDPSENSLFAIQNQSKWFKTDIEPTTVKVPYPVIYLDDIEIHFIHEHDNIIALDKFKRRFKRMKEIIYSKNYKIISLLSFSEIINEHPNPNELFDNYFINSEGLIIEKYFLGPPRHNIYKDKNIHYIVIPEWECQSAQRTVSHIYRFNNQDFNVENFLNNLKID